MGRHGLASLSSRVVVYSASLFGSRLSTTWPRCGRRVHTGAERVAQLRVELARSLAESPLEAVFGFFHGITVARFDR